MVPSDPAKQVKLQNQHKQLAVVQRVQLVITHSLRTYRLQLTARGCNYSQQLLDGDLQRLNLRLQLAALVGRHGGSDDLRTIFRCHENTLWPGQGMLGKIVSGSALVLARLRCIILSLKRGHDA